MSARIRDDDRIEALRLPPQSVESEQAVLGGLMLAPQALDRVASVLGEDDFYRRDHRLIYRAMLDLSADGKPIDAVTMAEWTEASGIAEQIGGLGYLINLASTTPSAANIQHYAQTVREKAVLRQLIEVGTSIVNDGFRPDGRTSREVLDVAISALMGLAKSDVAAEFTLRQALKLAFDDATEAYEHKDRLRGITTGFARLDARLGGWQRSDLVFIGARPSMGKTALMVNMMAAAAAAGHSVGCISGEQSAMQLGQRSLAADSRVRAETLRNGNIDDDDWPKLSASMRRLVERKVRLYDRSAPTLEEVARIARRWKHEHDIAVLFVDYLQRIRQPKAESRIEEVSEVSRGLKTIARDLDIPVVCFAQVKAEVDKRTDKRPMLGDIANSDEATREADLIAFLYRDEVYEPDTQDTGIAELNVEKNRHGPTGQFRLHFEAQSMFFGDLADERDYQRQPAQPRRQRAVPTRDGRANSAGKDR